MAKISSAEWEVMRVLWTKGEATSTEITKILHQAGLVSFDGENPLRTIG